MYLFVFSRRKPRRIRIQFHETLANSCLLLDFVKGLLLRHELLGVLVDVASRLSKSRLPCFAASGCCFAHCVCSGSYVLPNPASVKALSTPASKAGPPTAAALIHVPAGGNPGGFLQLSDETSSNMFLIAPQNEFYSGNLSGYVNGVVQFDARLVSLSGPATPFTTFGTIRFSSGANSASFDLAPLGEPTDTWTTYSAALNFSPLGNRLQSLARHPQQRDFAHRESRIAQSDRGNGRLRQLPPRRASLSPPRSRRRLGWQRSSVWRRSANRCQPEAMQPEAMRSIIRQSVVLPATADELFGMYLDATVHGAFTGFPVTIGEESGSAFPRVRGSTHRHDARRLCIRG